MNIGDGIASSLRLIRTEIPLELHKNFVGLKHVPLFYSSYVKKLSHNNKVQTRLMIATLDHLYCCHPNGDILRCFPYSFITMVFHDPMRKQVGLVIPREYDLLLAAHDTYQLIHVIETLRGLHRNEHGLEIRTLMRDKQNAAMSLLADDAAEDGNLEKPPTPNKDAEEAVPMKRVQKPTWFGSLVDSVKSRFQKNPKKAKGVIIGWNDQWLDHDHPQMRPTSEEELAIGKGYWALRLKKPKGFKVELYYRPDGTVIQDSVDEDSEEDG